MITAIYGNKNGTQDSIAWWLCQEPGIGPQIYNAPWQSKRLGSQFENPILGTLAEDDRDVEHSDLHIETLRIMENEECCDFLAPYRPIESKFKNLVWSNYFGGMVNPVYKIQADRVIVCNQTYLEDCFHYMISHAFKLLSESKVHDDSEVWWMDHVYVGGEDIGDWKRIWYETYHDRCIDDYRSGKLKYMWQLNYMHWDLMHAIWFKNGQERNIRMVASDDWDRLFLDKLSPESKDQHYTHDLIEDTIRANPDALVVTDPTWCEQADAILEYLGMEWTPQLRRNLTEYQEAYKMKRQWFDETFADYIKKYWKS
jgi:hypothetical protein